MGMLGGWKDFYDEYLPVEENKIGSTISHGDDEKNNFDENIKTYHIAMGIKDISHGAYKIREQSYWTDSEKDILEALEAYRTTGDMI